jgi:hypothetical protein
MIGILLIPVLQPFSSRLDRPMPIRSGLLGHSFPTSSRSGSVEHFVVVIVRLVYGMNAFPNNLLQPFDVSLGRREPLQQVHPFLCMRDTTPELGILLRTASLGRRELGLHAFGTLFQ